MYDLIPYGRAAEAYSGGWKLYRHIRDRAREYDKENQGMGDYGTYSMGRRKYSRGRKLPLPKYMDKLTKSAVVHQIERFSKVSDAAGTLGTNRGSTWLSYGDDATVYPIFALDAAAATNCTVTQYPIHLFQLCTTRCNPSPLGLTNGRVGWRLAVCNSGLTNQAVWLANNGWDRNTVVNPNSYPAPNAPQWEVEDSAGSTAGGGVQYGRNAMLEWTETRMLFYGKKTRPTYIKVSFVTFNEHNYCPDWQYYDNGFGSDRIMDNDASEYWKTRIQPLVNNPCTMTTKLAKDKVMNILSSYTIKIAPKESIDSDTDPHQEYRRWFNRWNRYINYSYENTAQLTNAQIQDPQEYPAVATDAPVAGASCFPLNLKGSVYVMVTSYQPEAEAIAADGTGPTNAVTASYDFLFRKSTAIITA